MHANLHLDKKRYLYYNCNFIDILHVMVVVVVLVVVVVAVVLMVVVGMVVGGVVAVVFQDVHRRFVLVP
jgi:cephalosporin-C deacetylase-like acetyl esterase